MNGRTRKGGHCFLIVLTKCDVPYIFSTSAVASMTVRNVVNKTCPNKMRIVGTDLALDFAITCHPIFSSSRDFALALSAHELFMLRAWHKFRHFSSMPPGQPIVAIVGSTGTGKSDVHLTVMPIVIPPRLTTAAS